jgi:hypothetical protein
MGTTSGRSCSAACRTFSKSEPEMRTKAVRPDHPDSGLQPRASKTVYLTRDHMNALAVPDGGGKVDFRIVQDRAGSLGRVIRNPDGRWGGRAIGQKRASRNSTKGWLVSVRALAARDHSGGYCLSENAPWQCDHQDRPDPALAVDEATRHPISSRCRYRDPKGMAGELRAKFQGAVRFSRNRHRRISPTVSR